jgi:Zn-finger nucleic acid-binding protein
MQCPIDGVELVMAERQGVEIDYCPTCRGVWLDRGELDKVIERAAAESPVRDVRPPQEAPRYRESGDDRPHYHRKRKSLLGDIFDF